jgi:hypothetical protein
VYAFQNRPASTLIDPHRVGITRYFFELSIFSISFFFGRFRAAVVVVFLRFSILQVRPVLSAGGGPFSSAVSVSLFGICSMSFESVIGAALFGGDVERSRVFCKLEASTRMFCPADTPARKQCGAVLDQESITVVGTAGVADTGGETVGVYCPRCAERLREILPSVCKRQAVGVDTLWLFSWDCVERATASGIVLESGGLSVAEFVKRCNKIRRANPAGWWAMACVLEDGRRVSVKAFGRWVQRLDCDGLRSTGPQNPKVSEFSDFLSRAVAGGDA